jgi:hypothetical protein
MHYEWSRVKRYSATGWKHCSMKFFLSMLGLVIFVSLLGSPPFWVTFSSLVPILVLYFPLLGFLLETLDRDWKDWHLW